MSGLYRRLKTVYWAYHNGELCPRQVLREISEQLTVLALFYRYSVFPVFAGKTHRIRQLPRRRKSVLMLSYYSPPYKSMYGTQRVGKFIKYLARAGWRTSLVTTNPRSDQVDPDEEVFPENVQVERISVGRSHALAGLGLLIPDDLLIWVRPAVLAAEKIVENDRPSGIFATAPPYSNLIAAAICARRFDLPLFSDFRDPWSKVDVTWTIDAPVLRTLNRKLEKMILRVSDHIIMADDDDYVEDYFAGLTDEIKTKIVNIPNGYDEEDFGECSCISPVKSDKFVISYVGSLYSPDAFKNMIMAFEGWRERFPNEIADVILEYAGPHSKYFDHYDDLPLKVVNHSYVSHSEAITIRRRSNVQIFAQPSWFKDHVLSGKIYEMIRTGVPIVAFTNPAGAVSKLLQRTGAGYAVRHNDQERAIHILRKLYQSWRDGTLANKPCLHVVGEYSRENQAKQLIGLLEREA